MSRRCAQRAASSKLRRTGYAENRNWRRHQCNSRLKEPSRDAMPTHVSNEPVDPYLQASAQAREAIDAARDTQESVRATRRRIRLNGLILSWRGRPTRESAVRSERLALILDAVRDEVDAPMGNIQLYENGALRIRTAWGLSDTFLAHFAKVLPGKCACGSAYRQLAPVIVDEIRTSPLFDSPDREMLLNSGIEA